MNERRNKRSKEQTESLIAQVLTVLPVGLRAPLGVFVGQLGDVPVVDSGGGRRGHGVLVLTGGVTALGVWTGGRDQIQNIRLRTIKGRNHYRQDDADI